MYKNKCITKFEYLERATNILHRLITSFSFDSTYLSRIKAKTGHQPAKVDRNKSDKYINYLLKVNKELKEENKMLEERATNISYIMSDLNIKVKDLENEKASLLTVIKILQPEQVHETSHGDWKSPRKNVIKRSSKEVRVKVQEEQLLATSSRYSTLQIVESDDDTGLNGHANIRHDSIVDLASPDSSRYDKNWKTWRQDEQQDKNIDNVSQDERQEMRFNNNRELRQQQQHQNRESVNAGPPDGGRQDTRSSHTVKTMVLIGDSMIKQIDCKRLQWAGNGWHSRGSRIRNETYRGANSDAMKHYVKPCLTTKPDRIILHVGTNDIGTGAEKEITKRIGDICKIIHQECPNTKIALSMMVTRADKPDYKAKVQKVNKELAELCEYNNYDLIKHENIEARHLNPYGIHQNRQGSSIMASNLLSYLNNIKYN